MATAINPDILIIDELLGAGDGYFVSKCRARMNNLVNDTTLLLVSHSIGQIQEYCDRVIWLTKELSKMMDLQKQFLPIILNISQNNNQHK